MQVRSVADSERCLSFSLSSLGLWWCDVRCFDSREKKVLLTPLGIESSLSNLVVCQVVFNFLNGETELGSVRGLAGGLYGFARRRESGSGCEVKECEDRK